MVVDNVDYAGCWSREVFRIKSSRKRRLRYHRFIANEMGVDEPDIVGVLVSRDSSLVENTDTLLGLRESSSRLPSSAQLRSCGLRIFSSAVSFEDFSEQTDDLEELEDLWLTGSNT
mmetsp:Transcript_6074/g.18356  ORF Transcript_6074/g.18356 Transcript_6074/m.18356 type:complete len:116 (+) Transcript_6074:36-383(+)